MTSTFRTSRRALAVAIGAGLVFAGTGAQVASAVTGGVVKTAAIRTDASSKSAAVGGLVRGQRISTVGQPSHGWVRVRFAGSTKYVYADKLDLTGARLPVGPARISPSGVKITTAGVNLRAEPSARARILTRITEGSRLTLTGAMSSGFAQTDYRGRTGWVSTAYLASSITATRAPTRPTRSAQRTSLVRSDQGTQALAFSKRQIGKKYTFGSVGPDTFDCSGLTLASWRAAGVTLPRTSQQQFASGKRVRKSDLKPGDLVFFYGRNPAHVGIYAGDGRIVHSPRPGKKVEITMLAYMPYIGAVRPG